MLQKAVSFMPGEGYFVAQVAGQEDYEGEEAGESEVPEHCFVDGCGVVVVEGVDDHLFYGVIFGLDWDLSLSRW